MLEIPTQSRALRDFGERAIIFFGFPIGYLAFRPARREYFRNARDSNFNDLKAPQTLSKGSRRRLEESAASGSRRASHSVFRRAVCQIPVQRNCRMTPQEPLHSRALAAVPTNYQIFPVIPEVSVRQQRDANFRNFDTSSGIFGNRSSFKAASKHARSLCKAGALEIILIGSTAHVIVG